MFADEVKEKNRADIKPKNMYTEIDVIKLSCVRTSASSNFLFEPTKLINVSMLKW